MTLAALAESTTFWVAISFCIFWAFAFRPLLRGVQGWLDGKIAHVRRDLDAAAALRVEAERLLAEAQSRHEAAAREAEDMVTIAQAEAQMIGVRAERDLAAALAVRESQAVDRIAQAEKQAMADLQQLAGTVAVDAVRSLLHDTMTDADRASLADRAIADLAKSA